MRGSHIREMTLARRSVGSGHPPFIVAEMSGNHNGSIERALEIVDAVADAGADAIKLQTYTADTMTLNVDAPLFRLPDDHPLWGGRLLHELYAEASTPWDWHERIFSHATERGLLAFSSPFDNSAVEFLEALACPVYKIASSEITDLPLIRSVARTGKPVIISTGMATAAEIDEALRTACDEGNGGVVLMVCTADYPADPRDSHLRRIPAMADAFGVVVGLSDHTLGTGTAIAGIALGAAVIEKHVTLERSKGGVDAAFSLEPDELRNLVTDTRFAWQALGDPTLGPQASEVTGLAYRRSLFVTEPVEAGDVVSRLNVRAVRPAGGLPPDTLHVLLGRRFTKRATPGTPLTWDLVGSAGAEA